MSARAASRLQTLGYARVFRYAAGKVDWLSSGLPSEGDLSHELRIGAIARTDVRTCQPGQLIADLQSEEDIGLWVVLNQDGVVLGDLRGAALHSDPRTPVDKAMRPGPSTYRPNVSVTEMAHHMLETGARHVLVTDADGHLRGSLTFDDVLRAVERQRAHAKSST